SPSFSACCTAAAAPGVHTLSLHDALPICIAPHARPPLGVSRKWRGSVALSPYSALGFSRAASIGEAKSCFPPVHRPTCRLACPRSEEHTSELQSRENLVCRLLLEKKNRTT